jgi:hypothetical protein
MLGSFIKIYQQLLILAKIGQQRQTFCMQISAHMYLHTYVCALPELSRTQLATFLAEERRLQQKMKYTFMSISLVFVSITVFEIIKHKEC